MAAANTTETIIPATKTKPFEVIRRNGRFRVRDSRTGRMMTSQVTKGEAIQMAGFHNQRAAGPHEPAAGGHWVQRSPSGRSWAVLDPYGAPVKGLTSRTRKEALAKVDAMLTTRSLMAKENQ